MSHSCWLPPYLVEVTADGGGAQPDLVSWSTGRSGTLALGRPDQSRFQGLEVAVIGNNLLDRPYVTTISGQGVFLGAPRTVSLNVTALF